MRIRGRVSAVAVVAMLAVACSAAPDETDATGRSTVGSPPATAPDSTSGSILGSDRPDRTPGTQRPIDPEEAALLDEIADLSQFVEDVRGLDFVDPVDARLASGDEFEDLLFDAITEDDWDDMVSSAARFEALDLIEPDTDVRAVISQMLGAGVLGFYDPITDELVVRGSTNSPLVRSTLVHELVHALDDQHFDLDRPELSDRDDESAFGFSAVVEGNARHVERLFVDEMSRSERDEMFDEEDELMDEQRPRMAGVPEILIDELVAPYEFGSQLIEVIVASGGFTAVDEAIEGPPVSSEQVIHPEAHFAGEAPRQVPHPQADAGGEIIDQGTFGEITTQLVLADAMGRARAQAAASGWGGDRYVTWHTPGGATCIRVNWIMDTPEDLDELRDALAIWVGSHPIASLSSPASDVVALESCADSEVVA